MPLFPVRQHGTSFLGEMHRQAQLSRTIPSYYLRQQPFSSASSSCLAFLKGCKVAKPKSNGLLSFQVTNVSVKELSRWSSSSSFYFRNESSLQAFCGKKVLTCTSTRTLCTERNDGKDDEDEWTRRLPSTPPPGHLEHSQPQASTNAAITATAAATTATEGKDRGKIVTSNMIAPGDNEGDDDWTCLPSKPPWKRRKP